MSHRSSIFRFYPIRRLLMAVMVAASTHLSAQSPDTGEDIRGPKALVEIPVPKEPPYALWLGIGGGVLFVVLAIILWRNYSRKQRPKTPQEIALASLTALEAMPSAIASEAFANRAALIVRKYIAIHFGLAAPRRTTEEFFRELAELENTILMGESDHLKSFLKSCDLAKFAGVNFDSNQRGALIEAARGFIHSTSKADTP